MAQKILAIDYGTKRVGLAVSWNSLAEPLTVLANTPTLFADLAAVIAEQQPDLVVVGLSEQEMAKQTMLFAEELQKYLADKLPQVPEFTFTDETLSSVEVHQKLRETGKRNLKNHGPIDHYAAAQFLQEYLDLHQNQENQ